MLESSTDVAHLFSPQDSFTDPLPSLIAITVDFLKIVDQSRNPQPATRIWLGERGSSVLGVITSSSFSGLSGTWRTCSCHSLWQINWIKILFMRSLLTGQQNKKPSLESTIKDWKVSLGFVSGGWHLVGKQVTMFDPYLHPFRLILIHNIFFMLSYICYWIFYLCFSTIYFLYHWHLLSLSVLFNASNWFYVIISFLKYLGLYFLMYLNLFQQFVMQRPGFYLWSENEELQEQCRSFVAEHVLEHAIVPIQNDNKLVLSLYKAKSLFK